MRKTPEQQRNELDARIQRICRRLERLYATQEDIEMRIHDLEEQAWNLREKKEAIACD